MKQLLNGEEYTLIRQGYALLQSLDNGALVNELCQGTSIDYYGRIRIEEGMERKGFFRGNDGHRVFVALALLPAVGRLENVSKLDLSAVPLCYEEGGGSIQVDGGEKKTSHRPAPIAWSPGSGRLRKFPRQRVQV